MKLDIVRKLLELEILHVSCWVVNHLPTADMTRYGMNCVNIKTISLNSKSILFPRHSDVVMVGDGVGGEGWASLLTIACHKVKIKRERNFTRHFPERGPYGIRIQSLFANKVYQSQPYFGCLASKNLTTKFDSKFFTKEEFENVFIFFRVSSIIVINYVHGKFNIKNRQTFTSQKCRSVESIYEKKNYYENISALIFFSYCLSQNVVYPKFLFFSTLRRLRVVSNKNSVVKVLMLFVKLIKL